MVNPTACRCLPSCCETTLKQNRFPIAIAVGTIVLLGGLFLILSAYQVLPVHAISELGPGGQALGYIVSAFGCAILIVALIKNRCPQTKTLNSMLQEPETGLEFDVQDPESVQRHLKSAKVQITKVCIGVLHSGTFSSDVRNYVNSPDYEEMETFSITKGNAAVMRSQMESKVEEYAQQGRLVFIDMHGETKDNTGAIICTLYLNGVKITGLEFDVQDPESLQSNLKLVQAEVERVCTGVLCTSAFSTNVSTLSNSQDYKMMNTYSITKQNAHTMQSQIEAKAEEYSKKGRQVFMKIQGSTKKNNTGAITCTLYLKLKSPTNDVEIE